MPEIESLYEWKGQTIVDRDGDKLGKLEDIYVDTTTDEPQFGSVKEGLLGRRRTFVPLAGASVSRDHIQVTWSKEQVSDAPSIDSDAELTADNEVDLYRYYGLAYEAAPTQSGRRLARR